MKLQWFPVGHVSKHPASNGREPLRHALVFFWFLLIACWIRPVLASPPVNTPSRAFAQVSRLEGELVSDGPQGQRILRLGDTVLVGERLTAGATTEAVLKTQDAGYIAIRPGSEFRALQFVAEGKPTDSTHLEILRGALRIISGWIGKLNRKGNLITTPAATVGIRGTDHEPFVLLGDDEDAPRYKPGTYDKVNQGGTVLTAAGQSVDILPGKVGFARSPGKSRALLTLLFPVLLEKVPDFYVPGKFDEEMDAWAKTAATSNEQQLQIRRAQASACVPGDVAKQWVRNLDQHIVGRDAAAILEMFTPGVQVKAIVRGANGTMTELELAGTELADSIVAAVAALSDYKHRRITLEGKSLQSEGAACGPIEVRSLVIEEGRQAGKPYRFESEETYQIEQFDGVWRATRAQTRQR